MNLEELKKEYSEMFGDSFPMFQFAWASEDEIAKILKTCLKKKKDVYDLKILTLDEDVLY